MRGDEQLVDRPVLMPTASLRRSLAILARDRSTVRRSKDDSPARMIAVLPGGWCVPRQEAGIRPRHIHMWVNAASSGRVILMRRRMDDRAYPMGVRSHG
jgi:hypothetical protein